MSTYVNRKDTNPCRHQERANRARVYGKHIVYFNPERRGGVYDFCQPANAEFDLEFHQALGDYCKLLNGVACARGQHWMNSALQHDACFREIVGVVTTLSNLGHRLRVEEVLRQHQITKVVDLPTSRFPALLYDLKKLVEGLRP